MHMPDMVLYIVLLLAQFATVGTLESRRFATIISKMGCHRTFGSVTLAARGTWITGFRADLVHSLDLLEDALVDIKYLQVSWKIREKSCR